jgi:predicted SAM-dependent methyltransferase
MDMATTTNEEQTVTAPPRALRMPASGYVQYGCGLSAPQGWLNFDASPTLRVQRLPLAGLLRSAGGTVFPANVRYGDIVKGLPVEPGSCRAVYCSHVLEHLSLSDFRVALANTRAVLAKGGLFRLVVPDLRVAAQRYVADPSDTAASRFMTETFLGVTERPRGVRGLLRSWLGNSHHLWMWDYPSLSRELATAGFKDIRPARMGDSSEPMRRLRRRQVTPPAV